MEQSEKAGRLPHQVIIQDRNGLELTGVEDVDSFDETTVLVYTSMGQLTVRGQGLHIRRLEPDGGSLTVDGQVDSLVYADKPAGKGGFWGRLLR